MPDAPNLLSKANQKDYTPPAAGRARERCTSSRLLKLLCAASVVISLAHYCWTVYGSAFRQTNWFDDAYMYLRYASNFLAGHGIAWNPGDEQIFGVTSLLHLFLVTALEWSLPLRDSSLLVLSSALPGLAVAVLLATTCSLSSARCDRQPLLWAGLLFPLLLVADESFLFHAQTGMDTMLSVLCNTLLIACALWTIRGEDPARAFALAPVAYLTFLARPDNGIYAALFPPLMLLAARRPGQTIRFIAVFACLLATDALAKYLAFGDWFPLGYYAKKRGYYVDYAGMDHQNPLANLSPLLESAMPFLVAITLFVRRHHLRMAIVFLGPVLATTAYHLTVVQVMGMHSRFYYSSLPFFVVCAGIMFRDLGTTLRNVPTAPRPSVITRTVLIVLLVSAAPGALRTTARAFEHAFIDTHTRSFEQYYDIAATEPLPELGWMTAIDEFATLASMLPPNTVVALSESGKVGAKGSRVTIIDVVGLHDRHFAHHGFSVNYLLDLKPDLIWGPHVQYTGIVREILTDQRFWNEYLYYPRAFDYGLAIRKSSPRFGEITRVVKERWTTNYAGFRLEEYVGTPTRDEIAALLTN